MAELRSACLSYLLSVELFARCMEFVDAAMLDAAFLSFFPSALAASALLLVFCSPPSPVCLHLLLSATSYSLQSLLPCIHALSLYSPMEYRGVGSGKGYFPELDARERADERWGRQTHWEGMLDLKAAVDSRDRDETTASSRSTPTARGTSRQQGPTATWEKRREWRWRATARARLRRSAETAACAAPCCMAAAGLSSSLLSASDWSELADVRAGAPRLRAAVSHQPVYSVYQRAYSLLRE